MLKVDDISKKFGGVQALTGCSFEVAGGTITGLIGPNGAGKTTLFNIISGILRPDEGRIHFSGKRIDALPSHAISRCGLVRTFQIPRSLEGMSVWENLLLYPGDQLGEDIFNCLFRNRSMKRQERILHEKAAEILNFFNLYDLRNAYARELSGGQKKLLELARVLMAEPKMIMLDEPGAGVNPTLLNELIDKIQQLKEQGFTFLLIEHDMDLILRLCNPVIVMVEGQNLTEGTFNHVCRDPRVLEAYLGKRTWDC